MSAPLDANRDPLHERSAAWMIGLAGTIAGAGGLLLGLQVDAGGHLCGTGYASLAIGALLAVLVLFVRARGSGLPRNGAGVFGIVASFFALAFLFAGVLAPGGPWMFFEVFVLVIYAAVRRLPGRGEARGELGGLVLLALMLLFRLWITYQGSERHWQLVSIDVPIVSSLPFQMLDPIKSVSLGSFTPQQMGFPPAGLDFPVTMALWALGFALCVASFVMLERALVEHENDRIHALIRRLPPSVAALVERLIPEEDWQRLGLHGLAERALARRLEQLVRERLAKQREVESAWRASAASFTPSSGELTDGIQRALFEHRADANRDPSRGTD